MNRETHYSGPEPLHGPNRPVSPQKPNPDRVLSAFEKAVAETLHTAPPAAKSSEIARSHSVSRPPEPLAPPPAPLPPSPPPRAALESHAKVDNSHSWLADRSQGPTPHRAIFYHAPSHVFQAPGGGENQLVQTGRQLLSRGLPVRPFSPWVDKLTGARLLHLFGMSREGLELARLARTLRVPVAISPICWIEPRAILSLPAPRGRRIASLGAWALNRVLPGGFGWRTELLDLCQAILPNSVAEAAQLTRLFAADPARIHVVPNGVDPRFAQAKPEPFRRAHSIDEPFVLYVGRVEPRKNLLGLIRALQPARKRLVVIGDVVPGHERYGEACRRAGRARVRWIPRLPHHDPLLASAYTAAKVFAMPSWFETPCLAALEAALAGIPIVITPYGSTIEYFGELALYARPGRRQEIAQAVESAWENGPSPNLAASIQSRFPWTEVARLTAKAYDAIAS